jgi:hypothetical protein
MTQSRIEQIRAAAALTAWPPIQLANPLNRIINQVLTLDTISSRDEYAFEGILGLACHGPRKVAAEPRPRKV